MTKSSVKPILFSKHFGINPSDLTRAGVFDPSLNVDTLLFPDPLLLEKSAHPEMRDARKTFDDHFERIRKLLLASKGDEHHVGWRAAQRMMRFPEIRGTCLGYGSGTISGSGAGPKMTTRLMRTGYQVASLGIDDPDLFMAIGLFEEDFGPDLIGDMFTNVCFSDIVKFNARISVDLQLPTEMFPIRLANGQQFSGNFVPNPTMPDRRVPVILLPLDILRDLPIAQDWRGVQEVSEQNQAFRDSLNESVVNLWSKKTLESKDRLKDWALKGRENFGDLLDLLHGMDGKPYDFSADRFGEIIWRSFEDKFLSKYPLDLKGIVINDQISALAVVDKIIEQFRFLIEDRDVWRELYTDTGAPRLEKAAQRLFYIAAVSYCEANNLDITPEADTGRGPVDFKFSNSYNGRVLVEIKLSKNSKVVSGYERQLKIYDTAEKSFASRYIIIDVGNLGNRLTDVYAARDRRLEMHSSAPKVVYIDGKPRQSASKA